MNRAYEEAVNIMVEWWMKKSFETPLNQNNGDDSDVGSMGFLLMNTLSMDIQKTITSEAKQKFKEKLTDLLLACKDKGRYDKTLNVDYHPNRMLSESCSFAGIDPSCLPIKTVTCIDENNFVIGRYQYGGESFKI